MAICKMCHKNIPDGMDFCGECEIKRQNKADESYLDSLLSSVISETPDNLTAIYQERKSRDIPESGPSHEAVKFVAETVTDFISETEDAENSNYFPESDTADDSDYIPEPDTTDDSDYIPELEAADDSDYIPKPDTADNSEYIPEPEAEDDSDYIPNPEAADDSDYIPEPGNVEEPDLISEGDLVSDSETVSELTSETVNDTEPDIEPADDTDVMFSDETAEAEANDTSEEDQAGSDDMDELLTSLLADMDAADISDTPEPESDPILPEDLSDIFAEAEELNEAAEEEPTSEVDDLFVDITASEDDIPIPEGDIPIPDDDIPLPDFPEDSGSASDIDADIDALFEEITPTGNAFLGEDDLENSQYNSSEEDIDSIIQEIDSGEFENKLSELNAPVEKTDKDKKEKKEKKSLFQRLFANIKEERTPEQEAAYRKKLEDEENQKKEQAELKKKRAEESKAEKEEKKKQEKAEKDELKKQKAEQDRKKKEEAKEKARKKKEEKLALEEYEVDEGRINRAGATILFVIFAILTVIIIVGTNIYSYNLSIKNAEKEFEIKHYNDAYYEVYGLTIQEEDIELYDKIMTVMYVNVQLNAYEYYMTSNNREKALDSLLKGLQRYDKYLELATILDIEDDLNYVKSNILSELNNEFNLSESEAYEMVDVRDEVDYSEYIYSLLGTYEVNISE